MWEGAPLDLSSEDSYEGDCDIFNEDDELCCVCNNKWEQEELQQCAAFLITKLAKCDSCPHWTYLIYCSKSQICKV